MLLALRFALDRGCGPKPKTSSKNAVAGRGSIRVIGDTARPARSVVVVRKSRNMIIGERRSAGSTVWSVRPLSKFTRAVDAGRGERHWIVLIATLAQLSAEHRAVIQRSTTRMVDHGYHRPRNCRRTVKSRLHYAVRVCDSLCRNTGVTR